ncbi:MAG TPA: peptidylprolyl isomerase [Verrucomicrobiae bacterium]|nr:peptidylprolyl isomerase [Verrucomicrobiae bacterium]
MRLIPILAVVVCFAPRAHAELVDGISAVVNNTIITYEQVQEFAAPAIETLQSEYADDPDEFTQKAEQTLKESLEQLVERQLILHDFDVEGYKLPDSFVDELVQERINAQFHGDRATLMKTLQAQNETFERYREDIRDQYIISAMRNKNISQEIIVSPYKVENYYLTHQDDYKVGNRVQLRMITLRKNSADDTNTLELAREIRTEIKNGADFAQMASIHSQDSYQSQGGEWGWIDRTTLSKQLADVAFSLKPGELSDVIDTPSADYLMLVEKASSAHVEPLNDVRTDIETTLRAQQQAQIEKQWIDSLKGKTFIRIFQ